MKGALLYVQPFPDVEIKFCTLFNDPRPTSESERINGPEVEGGHRDWKQSVGQGQLHE